jgi:CRP-like cAMP-binding protein
MGMNDDELSRLLPRLHKKSVSKNTFLLRQGDQCPNAFFVESGLLRSYTIDDTGKDHIIQFAPENWFISDRSSAYFHEPSLVFIEAIEDSVVIVIDQYYNDFIREIPSYKEKNEMLLQNHIRHLQNRINALLGATAEARYLDFIRLYPNVSLRVPQWMIASYLGVTPESLSRVRKDLANRHYR